MSTPQQPGGREPWYRPEPFPGFAAPEPRRPTESWTPAEDPLTGPLPPDPTVPASIAEAQEAAQRQHAERVPRYAGSAAPVPGDPAAGPPGASAMADPPASGPPAGAAPEARTNALPTVPYPVSGHPGAVQDAEPGIPPSLAPMLSHSDQPPDPYTAASGSHPAAGPAPAGQAPGGYPPGPAPARGAAPRKAGNPATLAALVLGTLLAAVPSVLLLYHAVFDGDGVSGPGAVGATLMLIGLPTLAAGLYPLIGRQSSVAPEGTGALLRPPLAYLLVGLVLLLAAGLAVG